MLNKFYLVLFSFAMLFGFLSSQCKYTSQVDLKSLSASFPVWKVVTDAMAKCGNLQAELDQEYRSKVVEALSANPSLYQLVGVSASSITPLIDQNLIRPLDDLVAKYGKDLSPNQLIKVDGKVMAIAFIVNAQKFMYRKDIFERLNIKEPKSYSDVLKAAEKIKKANLIDYPLGGTYKTGWNLAQEFVNIYLGFGGKFFNGKGDASVNNSRGTKTLRLMKNLTKYMDPEYLTSDSTYVQKQFQQDKIAMANLWATRASSMNDAKESRVVGKVGFVATPSVVRRGKPATTIWWDGFVIAKNTTDSEAEAAFRLGLEGIASEVVEENSDVAIWLVKGYKPGQLADAVVAAAELNAPNYPSSLKMSVMHTVLGKNISNYLTGKKSAKATLADIEKDYRLAARESGI